MLYDSVSGQVWSTLISQVHPVNCLQAAGLETGEARIYTVKLDRNSSSIESYGTRGQTYQTLFSIFAHSVPVFLSIEATQGMQTKLVANLGWPNVPGCF